ncbi:MAG: glycosyltransferase family 39 protein [Patescibacteria group bacterium]|nr:glycosyltransferase family 39 protein [Patescibacteria group bacterium]
MNKKYKILILFLIVLGIACFFRLSQLGNMPAGLFPDEAANGLDALILLDGHHTPFFERGLGREALYFYLLAGSVGLLGIGVWQIHLVSALIGILTVIFVWLLAKKIFNTRIAFFASFFLASSAWHTTLSRTGFRAILVPLLSTAFFYFAYLTFIEKSSKKKRILFGIFSGIALALGFYTYISFRAMLGILALLAIILLLINRKSVKKFLPEIIVVAISTTLVLTPLIFYFIGHPDSFMGRAGGVSIFNPNLNQGDILGTFLKVLKKSFWMFFTNGDLNWRHNVSGFGMLNPFVGFFFAFGFLYSVLIIFKKFLKLKIFKKESTENWFKYSILVVWFFGMMGPEILSAQGVPHGLRSIGVIPTVFLFSAIAIDFFWKRIKPFLIHKTSRILLTVGGGMLLIISLLYNYNLYFGISANSPNFYYAYRSDLTIVSDYLNKRDLKNQTFLVLDRYSVQTPEFLTTLKNQPYILVDPALSYQTKLKQSDQIIFTKSTIFDAKKFKEKHLEAKLIKQEFNQFGQEIMRVYEY